MNPITGGCHCGAIRYECTQEPIAAGHCQCADCRRFSGSGHCSHMMVPGAAVSLRGKAKGYASPADSGNLVTRYFCDQCGAAVYSTNAAIAGMLFLRASSLDDPARFKPQMVVWTSSAPGWDHVDPALPSHPRGL